MSVQTITMPVPMSEFLGVKAPEWLAIFDCRSPEGVFEKDPSGQVTVYGTERAEYALGLRSYADGIYNSFCPTSIHGYVDTREERWRDDAARWIADLIARAEQMKAKYDSLPEKYTGKHGGSGYYCPVAVALANYGATLICDRRLYRVDEYRD